MVEMLRRNNLDTQRIEPSWFPPDTAGQRYVPFKYFTPDASIAMSFYKNAQKAGKVKTDHPEMMLELESQEKALLHCAIDGSILILPGRKTIAFLHELTSDKYPCLLDGSLKFTLQDV